MFYQEFLKYQETLLNLYPCCTKLFSLPLKRFCSQRRVVFEILLYFDTILLMYTQTQMDFREEGNITVLWIMDETGLKNFSGSMLKLRKHILWIFLCARNDAPTKSFKSLLLQQMTNYEEPTQIYLVALRDISRHSIKQSVLRYVHDSKVLHLHWWWPTRHPDISYRCSILVRPLFQYT